MSQALYRKWRPQSWDEVVGQEHVVQTLRNALTAGRVAHAYLFAGPRGTGKTTTARLLAKAVNCLEPELALRPCGKCNHCQAVNNGRFLDLIEIDAASNTSVEDVRDLRDKINFSPNQGRYKVYIIDEVHMLSTAAFNALLKTLEEPPPHAIFVLATTEVHKIPATVLSRCQRHEFRRIPVVKIVEQLKVLAKGEDIQVEEDALTFIARQATGALRDAISLLDQLASTGQVINLTMAQEVLGTATSQAVIDVVSALVEKNSARGLESIHASLDAGSDPRQFARQIVDYLRNLLIVQTGNPESIDATAETRAQMARFAQSFTTGELLRVIRLFNEAATESRSGWQPALPLELAFLEALEEPVPAALPGGMPGALSPDSTSISSTKPVVSKTNPGSTSGASRVSEQISSPQPAVPETAFLDKNDLPAEIVPPQTGEPLPTEGLSANDQLFRQVCERWRQILAKVALISRQTQALLNSCKPYGIKEGVLFLGFNGDFAKTKMEKGDHVEITRKVITQVMEKEIIIRCFIAAGGRSSLPPDVDGDGMVAAALRDLGGEIVDIQG
jgi:DNA polymerase-3 subunit gamma/tau